MADQRSPGSRRTGTGRFAPHQLQESDMETAQRSLTDQFQQVQRRAQQLMESMNIPGAGRRWIAPVSRRGHICRRLSSSVQSAAMSRCSHLEVFL